MDYRAQYLTEKCSDPIEFLHNLRQTTEPIGGGTEYNENGEFVEYEIAVIAIEKAVEKTIEKVCEFLKDRIEHDSIDYPMATMHLIDDLKNYMKYGKENKKRMD